MPSRPAKINKASNTCKREIDFIAQYLAAELETPEQAAFERHLKDCSDCVSFLETYKKTIELTRRFLLCQAQTTRPKELSSGR
jgi:anti-sigma factor RsiW